MKFDPHPVPKKQATAVYWEVSVKVMNNFGVEQEFPLIESTNYQSVLDRLERVNTIIDNNYQFKVKDDVPF
jgi:hypothetical protein